MWRAFLLFVYTSTGAPVVGCGKTIPIALSEYSDVKAGKRIMERRTGTNFSRAVSPLMRLAVAAVELWCQPSTSAPSLSPCFHKKNDQRARATSAQERKRISGDGGGGKLCWDARSKAPSSEAIDLRLEETQPSPWTLVLLYFYFSFFSF